MLLTWSRVWKKSKNVGGIQKKKPGTTQWNGDKFKPNDGLREAQGSSTIFGHILSSPDFGREDPFDNALRSVPYRRSGDYNFSLDVREWHDLG